MSGQQQSLHTSFGSLTMEPTEAPTAGRATTGAGQLHTPHEPVYDSFSQGTNDKPEGVALAPIQTLSPPVSPDTFTYGNFRPINATVDPPLYAEDEQHDSQQEPTSLFEFDNSRAKSQPPPSRHDSQQSDSPTSDAREASAWRCPCGRNCGQKQSDNNSLLGFLGPVAGHIPITPQNSMNYYQKRMDEIEVLAAYRRARLPSPTRSHAAPRHPEDNRQLRTLGQPAGVKKNRSPPKAAVKAKPMPRPSAPVRDASPAQPAAVPASRRSKTPRARNLDEFHDEAFPGAEKKHKRAAPSKTTATKEEDFHWREMENFAPPLDTAEKPLKVSWPGQPLEIKDDVDYDMLNYEEREVCMTLRLKPHQYLANKRRIFKAKLQSLKEDKTFTRTAAQGSANIDVNKASQLWLAFDRCGWFDKKHFMEWL